MPRYASYLTRPNQRTPIFGGNQVKNDASGYVFELDPFDALDRFLILGCEAGTFYTGPAKMTQRAADIVLKCADVDPARTVAAIQTCGRRAIKVDPAIFALALLAGQKGTPVSLMALEAVNDVCRISTHLFSFVDQVTQFRGWGRALRRAIAGWYTSRNLASLAYQVTKYQQRDGWSHRDVLRLAHPVSEVLNPLCKYVVNGGELSGEILAGLPDDTLEYLTAIAGVKTATNMKFVTAAIRNQGLVREHIPTKWLNSPEVWEALLERMPLTAMIRNLGKMTSIGLLSPLSDASKLVCTKLCNDTAMKQARVHPFTVLLAQTTYAAGCGVRGRLTWAPDSNIVAHLEKAFYKSFDAVEPSGKNFLLGIDVSGSMGWRGYGHMGSIAGTHIKAYQAAAVMAMTQMKTEPWCLPLAFTGPNTMRCNPGFAELPTLSQCSTLKEVYAALKEIPIGPTDCALPMIYATERKIPVDVFVVYTDNETWCGDTHPSVALEDYRQKMGRDAKLVACGMTATNCSVADPNDPNMLDVVGFDASCPAAISNFAKGF